MIDERMFDFKSFYDEIALRLPRECIVAEVGVADGASALYLAKKMKELDKVFTLYMIDSLDYGGVDQLVTIYENIIESGLGNYIKVIPYDSISASKKFNGHSFDFVFLDSSHEYEETKKEIPAWYHIVKDDCILAGHDFFSEENPGVSKAVEELLPYKIYHNEQDEDFLKTEQTTKGNGIWYCRKKYYFNP